MRRQIRFLLLAFSLVVGAGSSWPGAFANEGPNIEAVISVQDQRLAILRDGALVARFPISTSRYGAGDNFGSYKTPLGRMRVCDKIGDRFAAGTVIRHRQATGEVLPANAPGRDPIVTRIIWLDGCESQNSNAKARGIYIHGTTEENHIGKPVSWGCIRMRSSDVIELFDQLPVGASVTIVPDRLPHYPKYDPRREILMAQKQQEAAARPPVIAAAEKIQKNGRETLILPPPSAPADRTASAESSATKAATRTAAPRGARDTVTTQQLASASASGMAPKAKGDVMQAMRGSILYSGLGDSGNSEVPRLGQ